MKTVNQKIQDEEGSERMRSLNKSEKKNFLFPCYLFAFKSGRLLGQ